METFAKRTILPTVQSLDSYSSLCTASQKFHDLIESINRINSVLYAGECVFVTYSNRDQEFTTYFKMKDDKIIETYYLKSGKAFPLICNQLITRGDSLIALNTATGYATKVEGRSELCYIVTVPRDQIFQLRSQELMKSLRNATDEALLSISEG